MEREIEKQEFWNDNERAQKILQKNKSLKDTIEEYNSLQNGIEEVEISKREMSDIADDIAKDDSVDSAKVRLQGKIIYIDIVYKKDVSKDKAKEIAVKSLDNFDKKEKEFYDFEYVLTQNVGDNKEDTGFNITGAKTPKTDSISFIKS